MIETLLLAAMLFRAGAAAAETIDATVTVAASGQLPQLAAAAGAIPVENRNAVAGGVGDLDGDGHLDILVWHRLPEEPPLLLLGNGAGGFLEAAGQQLPGLVAGQTSAATLVDLDGDGDLDAYLGRAPEDLVWINEHGHFHDATARWLPSGWGGTTALTAGDLTGDAHPDLVVVQGARLRVLENVAGTSLRDVTEGLLLDPVEGLAAAAVLDLDGDGRLDLAGATEGAAYVWRHDGSRLQRQETMPYPSGGPVLGLRSGDVTQDGAEDLFVARHGRPVVLEHPGTALARIHEHAVPAEGIVNDAVLVDLDRDGRTELLLAVTGASAVCTDADGRGTWQLDARWLPPENEATRFFLPGDFNRDGLLDVYVANDGQDRLLIQQARPAK